jgi:hypothetical protein
MVLSLDNNCIHSMIARGGRRLSLHLLMLTVCCSNVSLEIGPSFVCGHFYILSVAHTHETYCGKDLGISHADLLCRTDCSVSCLCVVHTILNLLEQGFHWLSGVPCLAHILKVVSQVHISVAATV